MSEFDESESFERHSEFTDCGISLLTPPRPKNPVKIKRTCDGCDIARAGNFRASNGFCYWIDANCPHYNWERP